MTTSTGLRPISLAHAAHAAHLVRAIEPAVLAELRRTDDAGRTLAPYTATGADAGAPLRCCLRPVRPGERMALVSYAPLRRWAAATGARPGAYDEQGPVFVHAGPCEGPAATAAEQGGYPFAGPGALRTLRRYTAQGHIDGGRLLMIPDGGAEAALAAFDTALTEAFAAPDVALVHVRAVEYGCFLYEVRRP